MATFEIVFRILYHQNLVMNRSAFSFVCFCFVLISWMACSKSNNPPADPCAGVTVAVTGTTTNATQGQSDGSISVSATGGSGFTFSLGGGAFQSSGNFSNLAAGTYTITARNSNGCSGSAQFTIGSNNPCTGVTITVTATVTNATTGQSNGSIVATATGGTGFTYSINGGAFQATGTFNNLAAGNYTITARTAAGCQGSAQFTVGANNPCAGVIINLSTTTVNAVPCGGPQGSITASATGSTGFTFSLNSGAFQAGTVFNNLAAGSYTITARDANGCTQTVNATVGNASAGPLFSAVRSIITANCAVAGCHNASAAGGINFTVDCNIVSSGQRIKARAVDAAGTGSQMPPPPNPALSAVQRQAITDWLTAGGRFDN
jgi:hypothetical protein